MGSYDEAELNCAQKGAKLIVIKDRGTYQFLRAYAGSNRMDSIWLGMNFTSETKNVSQENRTILYADGTEYLVNQSFAFDEESVKFGKKECSFLKRGVGHKPRDTDCVRPNEFICQWKSE